MNRRSISVAGPAAALIAFNCPLCLIAMAGVGAGMGSLLPIVQGIYWVVILGLGAVFVWSLSRKWKSDPRALWILILGSVGYALLIAQVYLERGGLINVLPGILMTTASLASFLSRSREPSCCGGDQDLSENSS